jgi:hypothetical protein
MDVTPYFSIVDSGTTNIILPDEIYAYVVADLRSLCGFVKSMKKKNFSKKNFFFPRTLNSPPDFICDPEKSIFTLESGQCVSMQESDLQKIPDLKFSFESSVQNETISVNIPGKFLIRYFPSESKFWDFCGTFGISSLSAVFGEKNFQRKFQNYLKKNLRFIILGETFMKPFYSIFDRKNNQIGFASMKNCGKSQ